MHCAADNAEVLTEQLEAGNLKGDQVRLAPFEQGLFEITDRDINEVPPYQNDEFMQKVKALQPSTMCGRHRQLWQVPPLCLLEDAMSAGVKGSIPGSASSTTSLVELSLSWTFRTMNGLRALFCHLHHNLL